MPHVRHRLLIAAVYTALLLFFGGGKALADTLQIGGESFAPCTTPETFFARFKVPNGGTTLRAYDGLVLVTVSGYGQSLGADYNDAFYLFADADAVPYPPHEQDAYYHLTFDSRPLEAFSPGHDVLNSIVYDIDAGHATSPPYVPTYRPNHVYRFVLSTQLTEPRRLHFGVSDGGYSDNSGVYRVEVSQLGPPVNITGVSATPSTLSPANNRLVDVFINYTLSGECRPRPTCNLGVSVLGTPEAAQAGNDWQVIGPHRVRLRADRGSSRVYKVTITCIAAPAPAEPFASGSPSLILAEQSVTIQVKPPDPPPRQ